MLLMVPGRIGTSSPELGIPVKFAGISQFCAIVEMDDDQSGYSPELSFGSHMFQDLVEAQILYIACMENSHTIQFNKEILKFVKASYPDIYPAAVYRFYCSNRRALHAALSSKGFRTQKKEMIQNIARCRSRLLKMKHKSMKDIGIVLCASGLNWLINKRGARQL